MDYDKKQSSDLQSSKVDPERDFPSINPGILNMYFPMIKRCFMSEKDKQN